MPATRKTKREPGLTTGASFASVADVKAKQPALKKIVAQLVRSMK